MNMNNNADQDGDSLNFTNTDSEPHTVVPFQPNQRNYDMAFNCVFLGRKPDGSPLDKSLYAVCHPTDFPRYFCHCCLLHGKGVNGYKITTYFQNHGPK